MSVAAVIIGKNEGDRLTRCFDSLGNSFSEIVYVDSGSTDDSVNEANSRGIKVVLLDNDIPFTAARARNEGTATLSSKIEFVQFIDGDCIIEPNWIENAVAFLEENEKVAAVNGVLTELRPEASIYNFMCSIEWASNPGEIDEIAGVCLVRMSAFKQVKGFDQTVAAGEEGEFCLRLRELSWRFWNLDTPMARHDAAIYEFSAWWKRCVRNGRSVAMGYAMHGKSDQFLGTTTIRRAFIWAFCLPLFILIAAIFTPFAAVFLALIYPLQIVRVAKKSGLAFRKSLQYSAYLMLSKFAELWGICRFFLSSNIAG